MQSMKGAVIAGKNKMEIRDNCPLPEKIAPTGALIRPEIWSPCTSDAHLCATGCESLSYLVGKAGGRRYPLRRRTAVDVPDGAVNRLQEGAAGEADHDRSLIKPVIYND